MALSNPTIDEAVILARAQAATVRVSWVLHLRHEIAAALTLRDDLNYQFRLHHEIHSVLPLRSEDL